jgi:hypothetical protein
MFIDYYLFHKEERNETNHQYYLELQLVQGHL